MSNIGIHIGQPLPAAATIEASAPQALLTLMKCPNPVIEASLGALQTDELLHMQHSVQRAFRGRRLSSPAQRLADATVEACRTRVRYQGGLLLSQQDTSAFFAHAWPKEGSRAAVWALNQQQQLRQDVATMHAWCTQNDGGYQYWGTKLSASLGGTAISTTNTTMMMAFQALLEPYQEAEMQSITDNAVDAEALWRSFGRRPQWARAAGQRALLLFGLLPEDARQSTVAWHVHGTALAFLGDHKRALMSFVKGYRAYKHRTQSPYDVRQRPEFVGCGFQSRWNYTEGTAPDYIDSHLELVKLAAIVSGSGAMMRWCDVWKHNIKMPSVTLRRHFAMSDPTQRDSIVFWGKKAVLRALIELHGDALKNSYWVRDHVTRIDAWQQSIISGDERDPQDPSRKQWLRHLQGIRRMMAPLVD